MDEKIAQIDKEIARMGQDNKIFSKRLTILEKNIMSYQVITVQLEHIKRDVEEVRQDIKLDNNRPKALKAALTQAIVLAISNALILSILNLILKG